MNFRGMEEGRSWGKLVGTAGLLSCLPSLPLLSP